jgi:alpha-galactosidase
LQGALVSTQGEVQVYAKPLASCGERAVVLLNRGADPAPGGVSLRELGLAPGRTRVRDLWAGADLEPIADSVVVTVPGHDAVVLRLSGTEPALPRGEVYLSDVPWSYAVSGWGPVERDQELGGMAEGDGVALTLGGVSYAKGLGTNSPSLVRYGLGRVCSELRAEIGIDDLTGDAGSVVFQVWADGVKLFDSGVMYGSTPPRSIAVDVSGRSELRLLVTEVEDFGQDHGNWADARLLCSAP